MRILNTPRAICLTMILATTSHLAAADGEAKNVVGKPASTGMPGAARLLADVTHLTDNDIRFHTDSGITVFVDPMAVTTNAPAAKADNTKPDLILITHPHGDHFNPAVLQQYRVQNPNLVIAGPADVAKAALKKGISVTELTTGKDYVLAGIEFQAVPAFFLEGKSHPQANGWLGYVLKLNGARYYVTGDTQPFPKMADYKPDVLFPLVYGCGGNLDQAVKMAALCKPVVVVPVHTSGQDEVIKKYLAQLPKGVQGAYYKNGKLVANPEVAAK